MKPPRRHHFVPIVYLKGFADPEARGKLEHLWYLRRGASTWVSAALKDVGVEKDWYLLEKPRMQKQPEAAQVHELSLEEYSNKFEVRMGLVLPKVRSGRSLTLEDQRDLALFVANLLYRTPRMRQMTKMVLPTVARDRLRARDPGFQEGVLEDVAAGTYLRPESRNLVKSAPLLVSEHFALKLLRMDWTLYHRVGGAMFITSDTPVAVRQAGRLEPHMHIQARNPVVSIPLGSDVALVALQGTGRRRWAEKAEPSVVMDVNRRSVDLSSGEVFSRSCEFEGVNDVEILQRSVSGKEAAR